MFDHRLLACSLFIATLLSVAQDQGASPPSETPARPTGDYVASHEERLSGWMTVESFHVPPGCRVFVDDDFSIHARKRILIEGDLVLRDRTLNDAVADAPELHLSSEGSIFLLGPIRGAKGRSFAGMELAECVGQRGGDGSSISLSAPICGIYGRITAGDPGSSGPLADGADAGCIHLRGDDPTDEQLLAAGLEPEFLVRPEPITVVGKGGKGGDSLPGRRGGRGGSGGDIVWLKWSGPR
ncbi:MAG: hypothetical protein H6831_04240 [Planctomycetes bacterium]|nr:hypothetical protein [Planctomycetota bacterium]MCB9903597.1 hypothetical protein [Planctomycetota bacterium]